MTRLALKAFEKLQERVKMVDGMPLRCSMCFCVGSIRKTSHCCTFLHESFLHSMSLGPTLPSYTGDPVEACDGMSVFFPLSILFLSSRLIPRHDGDVASTPGKYDCYIFRYHEYKPANGNNFFCCVWYESKMLADEVYCLCQTLTLLSQLRSF